MQDDLPVVLPGSFRPLEESGDRINANTEATNSDGNRAVLIGTGGRPATREELLEFVAEQNARYAREHKGVERPRPAGV